jgi:hypothetical protein
VLCTTCGETIPPTPEGSYVANYGVDSDGARHCIPCCVKREKARMQETGEAWLYLKDMPKLHPNHRGLIFQTSVVHWSGGCEYRCRAHARRHNWWGVTQTYVWFTDDLGSAWWGRNVSGAWGNEIVRCHMFASEWRKRLPRIPRLAA